MFTIKTAVFLCLVSRIFLLDRSAGEFKVARNEHETNAGEGTEVNWQILALSGEDNLEKVHIPLTWPKKKKEHLVDLRGQSCLFSAWCKMNYTITIKYHKKINQLTLQMLRRTGGGQHLWRPWEKDAQVAMLLIMKGQYASHLVLWSWSLNISAQSKTKDSALLLPRDLSTQQNEMCVPCTRLEACVGWLGECHCSHWLSILHRLSRPFTAVPHSRIQRVGGVLQKGLKHKIDDIVCLLHIFPQFVNCFCQQPDQTAKSTFLTILLPILCEMWLYCKIYQFSFLF